MKTVGIVETMEYFPFSCQNDTVYNLVQTGTEVKRSLFYTKMAPK